MGKEMHYARGFKTFFKCFFFSAALLFFVPSCQNFYLTCRSDYLYPNYLASTQAHTPDPKGNCFFGQQIVVSWNLPSKCLKRPASLILHVRYGNREVETIKVPIQRKRGMWMLQRLNQEYWSRRGILAFQAQIEQEGEIIKEWNHYLWVEIIKISPEENQ